MKDRLNRLRQKGAECGVTKSNIALVWMVSIVAMSLVAAPVASQSGSIWHEDFEDESPDGTGSYTVENVGYAQQDRSVHLDETGEQYTVSDPTGNLSNFVMKVRFQSDGGFLNYRVESGDELVELRAGSADVVPDRLVVGDTFYDIPVTIDSNTWYEAEVRADGDEYKVKIWEASEQEPESWNRTVTHTGVNGTFDHFEVISPGSDSEGHLDEYAVGDPSAFPYEPYGIPDTGVVGTVTDGDNDPIENATITVEQDGETVVTATTDQFGDYETNLENGVYTVTAGKTGYLNETATVTVDGDTTQNFQLQSFNESLEIDTRNYLKHGQTSPYTIVVDNGTSRSKVTEDATVTSNNTTIVTVDSQAHEIVATDDISVNGQTSIRAEYTGPENRTYVTQKNVTVANATVENLEVLPPMWRIGASVGSSTIQAILVAVLMGVFAGRIAGAFAGLGMMELVMVAGWFIGYVSVGMAMISLFTALFIGLNMAANIDYQVTRG